MDWKVEPGNWRGWTALLGRRTLFHRATDVSSGRNRTFCLAIRSNSTLHHRHWRTTTREQAIAETPFGSLPCRSGSALSAELPVHTTPGGIRTRDLSFHRRCNSDLHHGAWKGSAGNKRCCCCPCGRTAFRRAGLEPARRRSAFPRSNSHLHHRLTGATAPAVDGYAGEQKQYRCSGMVPTSRGPALHRAKYPTSSPPASVEPQ